MIAGITVEPAENIEIAGGTTLPHGRLSPAFEKFADNNALRPLGQDDHEAQRRLDALQRSLYLSDENYQGHVAVEMPSGYAGPTVSFKGNITADILANAFHYNLKDMADKVDEDGFYHTSTKDAPSWGGYNGFGTFRKNVGVYYGDSWTRDMGRSLQELAELGYTDEGVHCADYSLRMARLWEEQPSLKYMGQSLPRHWGRVANKPAKAPPFENDGHGLTTMFLYKLWQRLPNRDEWLRSRWVDVKAAGDWILWQFDHPEISGAANGVLHTTGECAPGSGYSIYADYVCMEALQALAQMADSIGETNSAGQWRERAGSMRQAIVRQYVVTDPKYGRVWTLTDAGWPDKVTMLGPLIFPADYNGFAPEDEDPALRPVNEATYQRFVDTHQPFGFYGRDMGYGQGFATQSALLLDRMQDVTRMPARVDSKGKSTTDSVGLVSLLCRKAAKLIPPATLSGFGLVIWGMACRRRRSSRLSGSCLGWMIPNRAASGSFRECPMAGARWRSNNIRSYSSLRARRRQRTCITNSSAQLTGCNWRLPPTRTLDRWLCGLGRSKRSPIRPGSGSMGKFRRPSSNTVGIPGG